MANKRILLTGASGFVGRELARVLTDQGDQVIAVGRSSAKLKRELPFVAETLDWKSLEKAHDIDAIVNLAGETVAQRWTAEAKRKIVSSRVDGLARLKEALPSIEGRKPSVLVSASAIGFYGDRRQETLDENSSPGSDFLAETCIAWEKAAGELSPMVGRTVILRIGMVLGPGGALAKMLPAFKLGSGGRLGSGEQWMSWIELSDLVRIFLYALDQPEMAGVYNAVAPEPLKNREFTQILAEALGRPAILSAPSFVLKLALGEMAGMLLGGQRISSSRLETLGFRFQYPKLREALAAVLSQLK